MGSIATNLHFAGSSNPWTSPPELVFGIHLENLHEKIMMLMYPAYVNH